MSIVISLLLSFSCSLDHRDLPSFPTRRSSDLCQEVTPDLVVFRQEVFDDFLSHEPVILRRSGRMDLDNRPIGPPTRVSGGLTARGTVQTVACKNFGH